MQSFILGGKKCLHMKLKAVKLLEVALNVPEPITVSAHSARL